MQRIGETIRGEGGHEWDITREKKVKDISHIKEMLHERHYKGIRAPVQVRI